MPQPPLKVDALEINPLTGSPVLTIGRDPVSGGIQFSDATLASPVTLAQLVASSIDNVLVVSKTGPATYSTIQDALDAVPAALTNPYTILVYGGVYEENIVWTKPEVTLVGIGSVTVTASSGTTVAISGGISATLSNITLANTGAGICLTATGTEDERLASLTILRCQFNPSAIAASATFTFVNLLTLRDSIFGVNGSFLSTQTQQLRAYNCVFPTLGVSYDPALNITQPNDGHHYLQGCRVLSNSTMTLQGTASFGVYSTHTGDIIFAGDSTFTFSGGSSAGIIANAPARFDHHSVITMAGTGPVDRDFTGSFNFTGTTTTHTLPVPQSDDNYTVLIQPMGRIPSITKTNSTFTLTLDSAFTGTIQYRICR